MKKKILFGTLAFFFIVLPLAADQGVVQPEGPVSDGSPLLLINAFAGVCILLVPVIFWLYLRARKHDPAVKTIAISVTLLVGALGVAFLADALQFWWPETSMNLWLRLLIATISFFTVVILLGELPRTVLAKSHTGLDKLVAERTNELSELNKRLELEVESRKLAEKEVAKREKRFRALIENITDGIVLNDENSVVLYQSPSVQRILGYSSDEGYHQAVIDLVHENDKAGFAKLYEDLATLPGQPLPFQFRFRHKSGHHVWLEGVVTNLLHDRNVNGYVANYRDISIRKEVEERLRQERYLLRTLIDNIPDYIYIKDLELRHIVNNKANVELIGASSEAETLGKTVLDYFDSAVAKVFMDADRRVLSTRQPVLNVEERVVAYNGDVRWLLTSKIPLVEHDQVVGLVGISRDITERKKAEDLLKELNASLALQASKLAASNAELERFAYVASHDLQEPLRMVRSFLQLLKKRTEGKLDEQSQQFIDFAVDGSERMKQLITDLLEYSRIGAVEERFEPVDMNAVVRQTLEILNEPITSAGATFEVKTLPTITGVKTQVGQLMQNLITNALKYRREVRPFITIAGMEEPFHWKFSVSDNGIGIDPRFFEKIFVIFQRLNNEGAYRGTGIGLAICKKIIEGHGGRIWVESVPGAGSTFHFTIAKRV